MNTKEKLIDKISHINDESILEEIMEIVDLELEMTGDEVQLTSEQRSFVDQGIKDLESGNIVTDQEAKEMTKEWLKKR
jgi:predicted transcriptional regulator